MPEVSVRAQSDSHVWGSHDKVTVLARWRDLVNQGVKFTLLPIEFCDILASNVRPIMIDKWNPLGSLSSAS
jgi:hypothetical protein